MFFTISLCSLKVQATERQKEHI
ncbi:hypothetical protein F01_460617 [Burkholderia cenocepacia]|nr:hypothetical protein F01_460617 [Burkholderia cenocepacia]